MTDYDPPTFERLAREAAAEAGLDQVETDALTQATAARVRRVMASQPDVAPRDREPVEFRQALRDAFREFVDQSRATTFAEVDIDAEFNSFLDGLCDRIRLPWPLCPATEAS